MATRHVLQCLIAFEFSCKPVFLSPALTDDARKRVVRSDAYTYAERPVDIERAGRIVFVANLHWLAA